MTFDEKGLGPLKADAVVGVCGTEPKGSEVSEFIVSCSAWEREHPQRSAADAGEPEHG